MLVAAWEEGLEGVEDQAVEMAVTAVESQLRSLITAMIVSRNGYKLQDGVPVQIGSVIPDPWLLNSQRRLHTPNEPADVVDTLKDDLIPVGRPLISNSQHRAMLEVACGSQKGLKHERKPLSPFDLLETMQRNKGLIPSHTVYSLNIERIISRLYHKGHSD